MERCFQPFQIQRRHEEFAPKHEETSICNIHVPYVQERLHCWSQPETFPWWSGAPAAALLLCRLPLCTLCKPLQKLAEHRHDYSAVRGVVRNSPSICHFPFLCAIHSGNDSGDGVAVDIQGADAVPLICLQDRKICLLWKQRCEEPWMEVGPCRRHH